MNYIMFSKKDWNYLKKYDIIRCNALRKPRLQQFTKTVHAFIPGWEEHILNLSWLESIVYGLVSGIADIFPVSAQGHRLLLLKLFGETKDLDLMRFFVHLGIFAAILFHCQPHIVRFLRAKRLSRVPKRRRKRPLDTKSLMDYSLFKTMLVPVILSLFLYSKAAALNGRIVWVAVFLLINGLILYIPQFLPGSNKDSRSLSRVEGLLMGLGGAASVLPGISGLGSAVSIGAVCGVDRGYGLTMSLLMNMVLNLGLAVLDLIAILRAGLTGLYFTLLLRCIVCGVAAFGAVGLGIRFLRKYVEDHDYSVFSYYCWGLALFTFILNLMA